MAPERGEDWIGLADDQLPVDRALGFVQRPGCGATVCFTGTVRDHTAGRPGVEWLEYEAYSEQVEPSLAALAAELRAEWPGLGGVALLHRVGRVGVGETSVVVAVSAPHREDAFAAARAGIDRLKETAPIWKKESWAGGSDWAPPSGPGPAGVARP